MVVVPSVAADRTGYPHRLPDSLMAAKSTTRLAVYGTTCRSHSIGGTV